MFGIFSPPTFMELSMTFAAAFGYLPYHKMHKLCRGTHEGYYLVFHEMYHYSELIILAGTRLKKWE